MSNVQMLKSKRLNLKDAANTVHPPGFDYSVEHSALLNAHTHYAIIGVHHSL